MAMLGAVPSEERPVEGDGGVDIVESPGKAGVVFQGLELGLGEGIVIAELRTAERACDPEVGEQLRGAFAGHGCAAIGVQGEDLGLDALLEAGLLDQRVELRPGPMDGLQVIPSLQPAAQDAEGPVAVLRHMPDDRRPRSNRRSDPGTFHREDPTTAR